MSSYLNKLGPIKSRYDELASLMGRGGLGGEEYVKLSREYAELAPVVKALETYENALKEQADLKALLNDPDMADMAQADLKALNEKLPEMEQTVRLALIPKDEADSRNAILEIRAGTGGDEAALFAADLFAMYKGYAIHQGWRMQVVEMSESDLGGYKEIIAEIQGQNVFGMLKFESGAHRVQRVPKTESGGRIHTSAATVAIMPEAEEVDIQIDEKDLRIDVFRAQGSGGQHVNKTESAVRVTHIPTGVAVAVQEEKSQHKNKARAMQLLRSHLYEEQWRRQQTEMAKNRKLQVGSGDRSERIRTYNFPQGRVTDHRINLTLYKLDTVLTGEALNEIIDELIAQDNADKLAELES